MLQDGFWWLATFEEVWQLLGALMNVLVIGRGLNYARNVVRIEILDVVLATLYEPVMELAFFFGSLVAIFATFMHLNFGPQEEAWSTLLSSWSTLGEVFFSSAHLKTTNGLRCMHGAFAQSHVFGISMRCTALSGCASKCFVKLLANWYGHGFGWYADERAPEPDTSVEMNAFWLAFRLLERLFASLILVIMYWYMVALVVLVFRGVVKELQDRVAEESHLLRDMTVRNLRFGINQ